MGANVSPSYLVSLAFVEWATLIIWRPAVMCGGVCSRTQRTFLTLASIQCAMVLQLTMNFNL